MKSLARYAVIGIAVVAVACDARREGTNESAGAGTAGENSAEAEWVEDSMASGSFEVELGKLAQLKASNPEVKQFAAMMVRDHTKAGEELKQVAKQHSIPATPEVTNEHRDVMRELSEKSGAEFDRAYMDAMVDSHQGVVDHLKGRAGDAEGRGTAATSGDEGDAAERGLNQWAAKTLPTARHHLDEARRIEDSLQD